MNESETMADPSEDSEELEPGTEAEEPSGSEDEREAGSGDPDAAGPDDDADDDDAVSDDDDSDGAGAVSDDDDGDQDDSDDDSDDEDEDDDDDDEPAPGDDTEARPGLEKSMELDDAQVKSVLESLIFVADKPVKVRKLARAVKRKSKEVRPLLEELVEEYGGRGLQLVEVGGGFQFRSSVANAAFVRSFVARKPVRLTRAQLETLAIVSYRQPVTRPEVDEIRGVDSGSSLKVLLERGLLKVLGRKDEPGRPLLYGTSPEFLEFFGLKSLKELPTLKEFTELSDESRGIFQQRMGEEVDFSKVEEAAKAAEEEAQEEFYGEEEIDEDLESDEEDEENEGSDADSDSDSDADSDADSDDDDDDDSESDDDDSDADDDDSDDDDSESDDDWDDEPEGDDSDDESDDDDDEEDDD